jgi:hypothetical protein
VDIDNYIIQTVNSAFLGAELLNISTWLTQNAYAELDSTTSKEDVEIAMMIKFMTTHN